MKELYELIKYLKDNGYEHFKINPDLLGGIVEYFESKQEPKTTEQEALHIGSVISRLFIKADEVYGYMYKGTNYGYTIEIVKGEPWLVGREYQDYETDCSSSLCKVTELLNGL